MLRPPAGHAVTREEATRAFDIGWLRHMESWRDEQVAAIEVPSRVSSALDANPVCPACADTTDGSASRLQRCLFVLGGAIEKQNLPGVSESLPSNGLIQLLFSAPASITDDALNLPSDPFFSTNAAIGGFLTYRPGPCQGNGACWKPGCSQKADPPDCTGP